MNIIDRLQQKYLEWTADPDNDPPNSIVMSIEDSIEFNKYLYELEQNESLPLTWLHYMNIFQCRAVVEIKIGRLI